MPKMKKYIKINEMYISKVHETHTAMPAGTVAIRFEFCLWAKDAMQFEGDELWRIKSIANLLTPKCKKHLPAYVSTHKVAEFAKSASATSERASKETPDGK